MDNEKNFEIQDDNKFEETVEKGKQKKSKKIIRAIITVIAVLLIIIGSVMFGKYLFDRQNAKNNDDEISSIVQTSVTIQPNKNPIDFASLQSQNDEIYAWIKVPDTNVDYPVCQSKVDDEFYLKHSATDKSWLASGAIYTESCNSVDFKDRVTVIYGHNGYADTMFTTLHNFESTEFFNEHPHFYVYTTDSKLTYQVISAFKYDNRHIMNSFNFGNDDVFADFIAMIQNPNSNNKNVRTELDKEIDINDNIVVLSTCITNQKSSRYLICGVLVDNEKFD